MKPNIYQSDIPKFNVPLLIIFLPGLTTSYDNLNPGLTSAELDLKLRIIVRPGVCTGSGRSDPHSSVKAFLALVVPLYMIR